MSRNEPSPDLRAARLAARNRRVLDRDELRACGLTDRAIAYRVANGRAHRMFRGIYLWGGPPAPPLAWETAALRAGGPRAALSHQVAGVVWELPLVAEVIDVTVPGRRRRDQPGLRTHSSRLEAHEIRSVQGLRVTSPERTLNDLAAVLDPASLERVTNEAEVRRLVPRRPGARPTRREAERRLKMLLLRAGLVPSATNATVAGYEVDVLFAAERLVIEMDSFQFHGTRAAFERDHRKTTALTAAGCRVLHVTWRRLTDEPEALVASVARTLALP